VPASEVYLFVETLLFEHGYVLSKLKGGAVPLVGVHGREGGPTSPRWTRVPAESLAGYADHPALLVSTVIDVAPVNAHQLTNSLRPLLPDAQRELVLPLSDTDLLLAGTGRKVAQIAALLAEVRERQRARPAPAGEER
jgi:hypothetical protein